MDKKEKMNKQEEELKARNESEETKASDEKVQEQEVSQNEEEKLADDLKKANETIDEQKDKYLRLSAEFDNYRKRTMKEKAELILNGGEKALSSILPVVDDLERALKNMETATDVKAVKDGVELIYNKFMTVLGQNGVKVIDTQDQPLNTDFHEAIAVIPAPEEGKKESWAAYGVQKIVVVLEDKGFLEALVFGVVDQDERHEEGKRKRQGKDGASGHKKNGSVRPEPDTQAQKERPAHPFSCALGHNTCLFRYKGQDGSDKGQKHRNRKGMHNQACSDLTVFVDGTDCAVRMGP